MQGYEIGKSDLANHHSTILNPEIAISCALEKCQARNFGLDSKQELSELILAPDDKPHLVYIKSDSLNKDTAKKLNSRVIYFIDQSIEVNQASRNYSDYTIFEGTWCPYDQLQKRRFLTATAESTNDLLIVLVCSKTKVSSPNLEAYDSSIRKVYLGKEGDTFIFLIEGICRYIANQGKTRRDCYIILDLTSDGV